MTAERDAAERLPRPSPKTPYTLYVRNRRVRSEWDTLLLTRASAATACWDHIANHPTESVGTRYLPLKGDQSHCEFRGDRLRQWQWEIDRGARVKIGVGRDYVVVMGAAVNLPLPLP